MIHVSERATEGGGAKAARAARKDSRFAIVVTAVFIVAGLFLVSRHEMWRDELSPWMIAKYSSSLSDLLHNAKYEGHPILWYLIVYAVTRSGAAVGAIQYVHLLLAALCVWLFARYARLPHFWRVLHVFGFYTFYQYAIVSRGYVLCQLGLYAFCALFAARRSRLLPLGVTLLFLANADVYGWFYSVALVITVAAAWLDDRRSGRTWSIGRPEVALSVALAVGGIIISPLLALPPKDCTNFTPWHTSISLDRLWEMARGMSFSYNLGPEWIYVVLSVPIHAVLAIGFLRRRAAAVMWLMLCSALVVFYYVKFEPIYWHKGMLWVYLMAVLWVSAELRERPIAVGWLDALSSASARWSRAVVSVLLVFFFAYGMKWVVDDIRRPYSSAKYAAEYIRTHSLQDRVIIGDWDYSASSVSGYLDRPIYYPAAGNKLGRNLIWDTERHWPTTREELCASVAALAPKAGGREMVLLLTYELQGRECGGYPTRLSRRFVGSVMTDEDFRIYLVDTSRRVRQP